MPSQILTPLIVACALFMENLDSTVLATSLPVIGFTGISRQYGPKEKASVAPAMPREFVFRGAPGCLEGFLQGVGEPAPDARRRSDLFAWALRHRYLHLDRLWGAAGSPGRSM